ncbi:MAG: MarR family transcriptional regulator [Hyphomonadaceae bacterium]|nr:MarR family transcriptional regulator [Hyphomonadaceae bacterium]GIK50037.1 MAG: MarR family transcriptional regulator [Alphaproteobacteria bacterium]
MTREQLSFGLARLAALARQDDWRAGEVEGLTPTQGDILRVLLQRPEGLRLNAVAAHLHISQPTASDAVTALERKGLLQKRADPDDGRALLLRVTRSGRALAGRWPLSFGAVADALSPADQAALLGIVTRAIHALQLEGAIPPQRMCLSCRYFAANVHRDKSKPHHCRFIDAPIGDGDLRVDCPEHEAADAA